MNEPKREPMQALYRALLSVETEEECEALLEDLCTIKELQDLSQRLFVATLLREGKGYQEISRRTGASTATICRVNKCLVYGGGGYRRVLARIEEEKV
jgi:TrpR-related protein YerC/YecD